MVSRVDGRQRGSCSVLSCEISSCKLDRISKLEIAQHMAGHESARATGLYDRRSDEVALDKVERIAY